jgi:hypothetical protein
MISMKLLDMKSYSEQGYACTRFSLMHQQTEFGKFLASSWKEIAVLTRTSQRKGLFPAHAFACHGQSAAILAILSINNYGRTFNVPLGPCRL